MEKQGKNLKISALNLDIVWKDKLANFSKIEEEFQGETADLFLLPEMFCTGFCMEADEVADRHSETLEWMRKFAFHKNAAVAGSVPVSENGKNFNRFYFVKSSGNYEKYDKRHLFSYSGENDRYTAGEERVIIEYKGVRFLLQVCYDLRFPVFSRNRGDYDAVLYIANWPEKRIDAWNHLLKTRAIENLAYVFGVNRTGTDGYGLHYPDSTHFFSEDGKEITSKKGNISSAEIDLAKLRDYRSHFTFLEDRDDFELKF